MHIQPLELELSVFESVKKIRYKQLGEFIFYLPGIMKSRLLHPG